MLSLAYNNIFDQVFLGMILNNYWLCQLSLLLVFFLFLGPPALDVLRRGLSELTALCEHMLATFEVVILFFF